MTEGLVLHTVTTRLMDFFQRFLRYGTDKKNQGEVCVVESKALHTALMR